MFCYSVCVCRLITPTMSAMRVFVCALEALGEGAMRGKGVSMREESEGDNGVCVL